MPRTITGSLLTELANETTTLAMCWKLTRADNTVLGFTSCDIDLSFDSVTYIASSGILNSAQEAGSRMTVDNMEVQGILDSAYITEEDILAGLYDGALIEVYMVDYTNTANRVQLPGGRVGETSIVGIDQFTAELLSISNVLTQSQGRTYGNLCDVALGSTKCGVTLASFTDSGTVDSVNNNTITCNDSAINTNPDDYYAFGKLTFTSGDMSGKGKVSTVDVLTSTVSGSVATIVMQRPFAYTVQVGDTFDIIAGCDKTHLTCETKFSNIANFRGFPFVPTEDRMIRYVVPPSA